jgi:peroxiredoxin
MSGAMRTLRVVSLAVATWPTGGCASVPGRPPAVGATAAEASVAVTPPMGSPHVGEQAPAFELVDQRGAKVNLASLRGSVVMLAFVTSWCPFSQAEQPYLAQLADDYRGQDVKVVAIDIKEDEAGYHTYVDRVPMRMPVLRDPGGDVTLAFTPPGLQPTIRDRSRVLVTSNLVLDRGGTIRFFTAVDTVHFDAKLLHARLVIDRLLAESPRT